jgi:hypothetical protein
MNIVEAILEKKKKYIILISGYLWWSEFNSIVKTLADNLHFELIVVNQLLPENKLITSSDHINFNVMNELMNEKIESDNPHGYIIVSYSFPPELSPKLYPDIHINIQASSILLTSLSLDLYNTKKISRMDVDIHLAYLSKSWKMNRIQKTITLQPDYAQTIDKTYGIIFDTIMENISKKLYGEETYEKITAEKPVNKYPLPSNEKQETIKVSDNTKLSVHEKNLINNGQKIGEFISDLDDIIDPEKVSNDSQKSIMTPDGDIKPIEELSDTSDDDIETNYKRIHKKMPYYIGKRGILN